MATVPLARRGYRVLCVELGENLAAVARRNLASYPRVEVGTGDFETYPLKEGALDLAVSATAFHWLDPAVAYLKTARALGPEGGMALFWNEHEAPEIVKPGDYKGLPRPDELPDRMGEIEASGLFAGVVRRN